MERIVEIILCFIPLIIGYLDEMDEPTRKNFIADFMGVVQKVMKVAAIIVLMLFTLKPDLILLLLPLPST